MQRITLVGWVAAFTISAVGCSPYVLSYTHLVFDATNGLEILESSTTSLDTQGVELRSPKVGMPLKLRISRPTYTLLFDTPLQTSPVVFLSVRDGMGMPLSISGAHVRRVHPGSGAELDGFEFSFYVQEAKGKPLTIAIVESSGKLIGTETIPYKVVSRGYSIGVESI